MTSSSDLLISLLPSLIIMIPLAVVHYFLAAYLGRSQVVWAILTIIPFFGVFFTMYVWYLSLFTVLKRVEQLAGPLDSEGFHNSN